jgi:sulfopropanediol 3-dehydrogenase
MLQAVRSGGSLQPYRKHNYDGDNGKGCKCGTSLQHTASWLGRRPAIVYAAHICGAHKIMALGGVQGVAAMTLGCSVCPRRTFLWAPGNQFVAEAKRGCLFGRKSDR